jgi:hypothetical protein
MTTKTGLLYKRRRKVEKKVEELDSQLMRTLGLLKKWRKKLKYYDKAIEVAVSVDQPQTPKRTIEL